MVVWSLVGEQAVFLMRRRWRAVPGKVLSSRARRADILAYLASDLFKAWKAGQGLNYAVAGKGPGIIFTAAQLQGLRQRVDLILVPCVNPDGRVYSMSTAPLWRKNRNPASSGGQDFRIGVDINRNFDFVWSASQFAQPVRAIFSMGSDEPASETFRGAAPNSEPETKNVVFLFDDNPHLRHFIDVHSYTGDVLHSWGDAPNQHTKPEQNFRNAAFDGVRGVNNAAVYGEYIEETDEADAVALANTMTSALKR